MVVKFNTGNEKSFAGLLAPCREALGAIDMETEMFADGHGGTPTRSRVYR
jgi:hypothetical protein